MTDPLVVSAIADLNGNNAITVTGGYLVNISGYLYTQGMLWVPCEDCAASADCFFTYGNTVLLADFQSGQQILLMMGTPGATSLQLFYR